MKITYNDIKTYIEQFERITVPQVQSHFNLSYADARKAIQSLENENFIKYDSGLYFDVVQISINSISQRKRSAAKKQSEKPPDDSSGQIQEEDPQEILLRQSRDELEHRRKKIFAMLEESLFNEDADDADDDDDEDADDEDEGDEDDVGYCYYDPDDDDVDVDEDDE